MLNKKVLIVDVDNTLLDWFEIWHRSFSVMLDKSLEITGCNREKILKEIRVIHQKNGTSEYAFLLEEIPSFLELYKDKSVLIEALRPAIISYRSERKKNLKLYDGVGETLKYVKDKKALIVAYTESKSYYSKYRLIKLGLDGVIDYLFTTPDHSIPVNKNQLTPIDFEKTKHEHTPDGELKPNPKLLLDIIRNIGASIDECCYVGDSEIKDISMSQDAGIVDVFAKYGNIHFENDVEKYGLLRSVSHWTDDDVEDERKLKEVDRHIKPTYEIDNFSQLLDIINFGKFIKND